MNKDTILKSDIKEIIRALRNDAIKELEASREKMIELQAEGKLDEALQEGVRSSGLVKGLEWAIRKLEILI